MCSSNSAPIRPLPDRRLAGVADALQLLADGPAGVVPAREAVLEIEHAGEHARCDHRGRKAAAFLVGPVDHLERGPGPDAVVVQRAHHLEGGEHAERAVELAAGRLAVEVAAEHHGRLVGVGALAPREHAAHAIDAELEPGFLAPGAEQVAAAPVLIGQRLPVDPAGRRRADLGHGHQALPQPLAVHPDLGHRMPPHLRPSVPMVGARSPERQATGLRSFVLPRPCSSDELAAAPIRSRPRPRASLRPRSARRTRREPRSGSRPGPRWRSADPRTRRRCARAPP